MRERQVHLEPGDKPPPTGRKLVDRAQTLANRALREKYPEEWQALLEDGHSTFAHRASRLRHAHNHEYLQLYSEKNLALRMGHIQ
jgi:hypothetical protein